MKIIRALSLLSLSLSHTALAQEKQSSPNAEIAGLRAEIEHLKSLLPDQSHAMKDVAYHFTNLYAAAAKKNWPLATFYVGEARAHLKWAVSLKPLRKLSGGQELNLVGLLEALDTASFGPLAEAVAAQDGEQFSVRYKSALMACYSCHQASEKPFLRLQIPAAPEVEIINFDPGATTP